MSKLPPIPSEQKSFEGATNLGRHDAKTGLQSSEPGDGDVNIDEQGQRANIRQNTTNRRSHPNG